jgi:hypothetical protein
MKSLLVLAFVVLAVVVVMAFMESGKTEDSWNPFIYPTSPADFIQNYR